MKKTILFHLLFLTFNLAPAQVFQWGKQDRWSELNEGNMLYVNKLKIYVASRYQPVNRNYSSKPNGESLSQLSITGVNNWTLPGITGYLGLAENPLTKNIYITHYINGSYYVSKYKNDGVIIDSVFLCKSIVSKIAFDSLGNYFISGILCKDTIALGSQVLPNPTLSPHLFMAKYDKKDSCLWAKQSEDGHSEVRALAVDKAGNSVVGGSYSKSITLDGKQITEPESYEDAYIARFSADGAASWIYSIGCKGQAWVSSLACDSKGNVYALGYYDQEMDIGRFHLDKNGFWDDIFFARFSPEGECLWAKKLGSPNADSGNGIWIDEQDHIYIAGRLGTSGALNNIQVPHGGSFVARFDTTGRGIWMLQPLGNAGINAVSGDSQGNLAVTGSFRGTVYFGSSFINSSPDVETEMFVALLKDTTTTAPVVTGVKEITSQSFNIYPNPSANSFRIQGSGCRILQVKVYSQSGAVILSRSFSPLENVTLELGDKPKGVYFVEVIMDTGRAVRKIVLE